MARILQFRKNKLTASGEMDSGGELHSVKESGNTALENIFSASNKFWSQNSNRMEDWYAHRVQDLNNNYLKNSNALYVKKIGDYSLAQNAALLGVTLAKPAGCYAWFLTKTLKRTPKKNLTVRHSGATESLTHSKPVTKKASKKTGRHGFSTAVSESAVATKGSGAKKTKKSRK